MQDVTVSLVDVAGAETAIVGYRTTNGRSA